MKNVIIFVITLFSIATRVNAQIPNNGFENWDNYGAYWDPEDFFTGNAYASGSFHPVTRSAEHYPSTVGEYSIRIESKPSLYPNGDAFGVVVQNLTNVLPDGPMPYFPIVGHPTSLTGYYKYEPQDGDTMLIQIVLYYYGSIVSVGTFTSTDTTPNWTSFIADLPSYVSADSGTVLLSAYHAIGHPPEYVPQGNSVLYVDNLNFDELINAVPTFENNKTVFNFYPNPASNYISISRKQTNNSDAIINIYNLLGEVIQSEKLNVGKQKINIEKLKSGVYILEINESNLSERKRLVIQK